jgi:tryptophan synthase alpha chain
MTRTSTDRYAARFAALGEGCKAFIPFTVLGYPDPETCFQTIKLMIDAGATAVELGIAFSDPVADGPIIQEASFQTLDAGFSVDNGLALIKRVRQYAADIPIGVLVYYNVVLAKGVESFFQKAAESGVDSVLIADLNPDTADEIVPLATKFGVAPVFIVSPMTSDARLSKIAALSKGYLYVVSRLGITGTEERSDDNLAALLARARQCTKLPLCVGFGVSSPEQAKAMITIGADGVITGSKIVELVKNDPTLASVQTYLKQMVAAVKA